MQTALYARVSTDEQAQQGFSIDSQKERLAAYCLSQGYAGYDFYVDDGYSGTNLKRPALQRLLDDIRVRRVDAVIVYRLDRLGRRQKDVLHLLEDVFEPFAVTFKSVTEPFDTGTPFGRAMIGVLAVFAQLERDTIIERTTLGRRQRIRSGLWPGGRAPFGYEWRKDEQALCPIPEQASLVQAIYQRFLRGESLSALSRWIALRSAERKWTHSAIRLILSRPLYAGLLVRQEETALQGRHMAIIDADTWRAAQAELARRSSGVTATGGYLLSGLLQCGVCGKRVIHFPYQVRRGNRVYRYEYYGCQTQHSRQVQQTVSCSLGFRRKETLEAQITDALFTITFTPTEIAHVLAALTKAANTSDHAALRQRLAASQCKVTVRRERWLAAYEAGVISTEELAAKLAPLDSEASVIALRRTELADTPLATEELNFYPDLIRKAWPYLTHEEQRSVIRLAIRNVTLRKDQLTINWNLAT